jgi:hypothetical protein
MDKSTVRELLVVVAAFAAGFVGGKIPLRTVPVAAASETVLRATRFVLTDKAGRTLAYWGSDNGRNPSLRFLDSNGVRGVVLGLQGADSPTLDLIGHDSKIRATLCLEGDRQEPILGMGDKGWEGRVMLGFIQPDSPSPSWDQWGLIFRAPQGDTRIAQIGTVRDARTGRISARLMLRQEDGALLAIPQNR